MLIKTFKEKLIRRSGRLFLFFCLFCAFSILLIAPRSASAGTESSVLPILDKVSLKLKWKHQFQFAGYYAALEKGFYRDSGLDVTIIEQQDNENSTEAILKGQCQFGIAGSDLILKRSEGKPVIALAAIYQHSPMVFLTKESSGIENIHQIAGRRVMLEEHSAELLAYLKSENISISQLKTVPHTYGVEELIQDKVDVISAYANDEPFNLKEKNINYRMFIPQSSGIDFYGDVLFTVEEQVKQHPARVKKFLEASLKGWQYALQNPEEISNLILNKYSKRHSLEHLLFESDGARRLILPDVVPIGFMSKGRWEHILEKYRSLWLIKDPVKIDEFLYKEKSEETNFVLIGFQIIEVMLALLAIWFVVRFIRIYSSHESLDQINREIQRKLRKNQKRFSLLLTNLPGMAYRCKFDENWTMLFISKGCFELTGYYPEELLKNRKLSYADLIVPEDRRSVEETVKSSFHRGDSFKITYRIKCKDGQIKWVWEQGRFNSTATSFKKLRIEGFITDISESKRLESEREELISSLKQALSEIKELRGILPICSSCKKIRNDHGYWEKIESYLHKHTNAEFSHGLCPDCAKTLYPEFNLEGPSKIRDSNK